MQNEKKMTGEGTVRNKKMTDRLTEDEAKTVTKPNSHSSTN